MTLASVLGEPTKGKGTRAAAASRIFVRSHMQLALDSEGATGRRITGQEAIDAYGQDLVDQVLAEGGAGLITDANEPARTLFERRRILRLSKRDLAQAAGVSPDDVTLAETAGEVLPFRILESIAQALALDERRIGLEGAAQGDPALGTRLRELRQSDERDENFVLAMTDAAWVIARQSELSRALKADKGGRSQFCSKSGDYGAPIWRKGYELADRTRQIMKLDAAAPIESMYGVAQDALGIPVIDVDLAEEVAGATILNGASRGIVLNRRGANRNILVRRMTIAHELGHLLWDPDHQLERVRVDESADLSRRDMRDEVEARANAFAVAFLAPRQAVRALYQASCDAATAVAEIVGRFGISPSAAAHHLANICDLDPRTVNAVRTVGAAVARTWDERERQVNLITHHVPPSRGSRFALLTAQAVRKKLITVDTAASWLKIDRRYLADFF
jgi:Zn-dependent peptidase ImmA (M78 family)